MFMLFICQLTDTKTSWCIDVVAEKIFSRVDYLK